MTFFRRIPTFLTTRYLGHPVRLFTSTLKTFFLVHLTWTYLYELSPALGASMLPTFSVTGDTLLLSKHFRRGRAIRVGDVVSFRKPIDPSETVIKRVVGLEGDYVMLHTPGGPNGDMIQVPQGHCWVVGDNLPDSLDSRLYGPVPMALIKGKVVARVFPWRERMWVENTLTTPEPY
jgi:inner membrane protease subunit 1